VIKIALKNIICHRIPSVDKFDSDYLLWNVKYGPADITVPAELGDLEDDDIKLGPHFQVKTSLMKVFNRNLSKQVFT